MHTRASPAEGDNITNFCHLPLLAGPTLTHTDPLVTDWLRPVPVVTVFAVMTGPPSRVVPAALTHATARSTRDEVNLFAEGAAVRV